MKIEIDEEVVNLLKEYGLNTYEAKAYYVLLLLGESAATSVARESKIPQQRIYDALKSLERKGLIQTKNTIPKKYVPLPVRKALTNRLRQMRLEFEIREDNLRKLIDELEKKIPETKSLLDKGSQIFVMEGKESIVNQAISMISSAESTIKIAGNKPLFILECKGNLSKYMRRNVELVAIGEFDQFCKDEIEKLGGKYCEASVYCQYLLIVDDKKLLIVYFDEKGVPNGLYTENEAIVKPYLMFFESKWKEVCS
ncbi:TrmB family transcriptional regulator [Desulfurobacterium thermolithotrophum]|uniref:TrmB family transcriptional regulator n=1 Tax=Desulfurobacterium thermolithotrophum TaxID=64160 RepID=UPI0013D43E55|nr:helix-turn-helix domain-containing protein [Desulfurobacterium thermolithotrophum]